MGYPPVQHAESGDELLKGVQLLPQQKLEQQTLTDISWQLSWSQT